MDLKSRLAFFVLIIMGFLTACGGEARPFLPPTGDPDLYRPATIVASITPPATAPVTALADTGAAPTPAPSSTPSCTNDLRFIEDESITDGTLVAPDQLLDKRWRVENAGTCNWDDRYRVQLVAGPPLGVPGEAALYPARSGAQATLRIVFSAPGVPGTYRSAWQAYTPQGEPFGDPFFIEVVVQTP